MPPGKDAACRVPAKYGRQSLVRAWLAAAAMASVAKSEQIFEDFSSLVTEQTELPEFKYLHEIIPRTVEQR